MFKEIILTVAGENIKAQLAEKPIVWACGKSTNEAVGKLIQQHREEFGISIGFDRNDKNTRKFLEDLAIKTKQQSQGIESSAIK